METISLLTLLVQEHVPQRLTAVPGAPVTRTLICARTVFFQNSLPLGAGKVTSTHTSCHIAFLPDKEVP